MVKGEVPGEKKIIPTLAVVAWVRLWGKLVAAAIPRSFVNDVADIETVATVSDAAVDRFQLFRVYCCQNCRCCCQNCHCC